MRKTLLVTALAAAAALPGVASAQASSPHSLSGNLSIVSDYRFRGISQTFLEPAIQGGIDYSHSSGFYLGNWNSNVSSLGYVDGTIEMDIYGGFKFPAGPFTLDVGLLQYLYPGAKNAGVKYDTLEAYIGASWKWFTLKYSVTLDDYFGVANSDGSGYLDLGFSYEIAPKLTLVAHYGDQAVENSPTSDYSDTKLGITYDLNGWVLGLAYYDTDLVVNQMNAAGKTEDVGDSGVVFSVSKSF
jgi:uncharacterized protein (TIGR02001 family)